MDNKWGWGLSVSNIYIVFSIPSFNWKYFRYLVFVTPDLLWGGGSKIDFIIDAGVHWDLWIKVTTILRRSKTFFVFNFSALSNDFLSDFEICSKSRLDSWQMKLSGCSLIITLFPRLGKAGVTQLAKKRDVICTESFSLFVRVYFSALLYLVIFVAFPAST